MRGSSRNRTRCRRQTAGLCAALIGALTVLPLYAQAAQTGEIARAATVCSSQDAYYAAVAKKQTGAVPAAVSGANTAGSSAGSGTGAPAGDVSGNSRPPQLPERTFTPEEEARIAAFYANTVLAGDSVLLGFRNYCRSGDEVMKGLQFLAAGSLSLHNAFWPVSKKSVHPLYQGEQHPVWESIRMMGADRVFLFFGINDMVYGVEDSVEKYQELIAAILAERPAAEINILSATYILAGEEKKKLNNESIAAFNGQMAALAAANGWGYVDVATPTSDGNGNLLPAYCTDGFLHQSKAAYTVWERVLKEYALTRTAAR